MLLLYFSLLPFIAGGGKGWEAGGGEEGGQGMDAQRN